MKGKTAFLSQQLAPCLLIYASTPIPVPIAVPVAYIFTQQTTCALLDLPIGKIRKDLDQRRLLIGNNVSFD